MSYRILILEDDPVNSELLERILKRAGYNTILAERGQTCLDMAKSEQPDLILVGYFLPDLDGVTVTTALKADTRTAAIPVLALSADIYGREPFMKAGASDYVAKPIRKRSLLFAIEKVLGNGTIATAS